MTFWILLLNLRLFAVFMFQLSVEMVACQATLLEELENYVNKPLYQDIYIDLVSPLSTTNL